MSRGNSETDVMTQREDGYQKWVGIQKLDISRCGSERV